MTTQEFFKLRINRVDTIAAKQSGLPPLFYTIKRCYGDSEASNYFRDLEENKTSLTLVFNTRDNPNRLQAEVFV